MPRSKHGSGWRCIVPDHTPEPVRFKNAQGHYLFGMYHPPAGVRPARKTAVILLSPGVKMRVAPHRLYNQMAEQFSANGFPVLRFDFWGLGDSEGECPEELLADLYGEVQVGRYVKDCQCAMRWLSGEKGIDRFVLGGLCGGAITGLLAGANDPRCVGLLALGIPVILDSANADQNRYMTQWQRGAIRQTYFRKLISPGAWLRLLTFKSDFGLIWRSVFRSGNPNPASGKAQETGHAEKSNVNPLFAPNFFALLERGCTALFIFSGSDRLLYEYEEKFASRNRERLESVQNVLKLHVVPNANHILSRREWKQNMMEQACDWLEGFE